MQGQGGGGDSGEGMQTRHAVGGVDGAVMQERRNHNPSPCTVTYLIKLYKIYNHTVDVGSAR